MKTSARTTTSASTTPAARSPITSANSAPSASRSPSAASPDPNRAGQTPRPPDPGHHLHPAPLRCAGCCRAPGWGRLFGSVRGRLPGSRGEDCRSALQDLHILAEPAVLHAQFGQLPPIYAGHPAVTAHFGLPPALVSRCLGSRPSHVNILRDLPG